MSKQPQHAQPVVYPPHDTARGMIIRQAIVPLAVALLTTVVAVTDQSPAIGLLTSYPLLAVSTGILERFGRKWTAGLPDNNAGPRWWSVVIVAAGFAAAAAFQDHLPPWRWVLLSLPTAVWLTASS